MRALDLFCGAGGAAMGLHQAGYEVVGVDSRPQPRYPFRFIQGDALAWLRGEREPLSSFGLIWASPPCQAYTNAQRIRGRSHPDLIEPVRAYLQLAGVPYIIENVPGAPLVDPILLVGTMFGLRTMRPRIFECSFDIPFALAPVPAAPTAKMGRQPKNGEYMHVVGNFANVEYARIAMGIDWMTRDELSQAIPPAYSRFLAEQIQCCQEA